MARKTWKIAQIAKQNFDGIVDVTKSVEPSVDAGRESYPFFGSVRMTYTICAFLAMIAHVSMRNTLSLVILCMVKPNLNDTMSPATLNAAASTVVADGLCDSNAVAGASVKERSGDLDWTRAQELTLQGTFYYGYIVTMPLAGRLADRFGGKLLFVHSITMQALVFMTLPYFARLSYVAAIGIEILQGLIAGFGNPALYQLFVIWAHPTERTALLSFAYGGYSIGTLLTFPVTSFLCRFGWSMAFYTIGGVSLIFGICCQWLVYSKLEEHPRLTNAERNYLQTSQAKRSTHTEIPWKSILTSMPVYAFTFTHIFHTYGVIMFTLMMPRFLKEAMRFPMQEVGMVSSALFLGALISKVFSITFCSCFEKNTKFNITNLRKFIYIISNTITIISIGGIVASNCQQKLIVVLMTAIIGATTDLGFSAVYWPSLLYFAPSYAGLLSGIANCLASCCGFLAPLVIATIVQSGTKLEWDVVMYTMLACYLFGAVIFGFLSSSKLQSWDQKAKAPATETETSNTIVPMESPIVAESYKII